MDRLNWAALVRYIENGRAQSARFYKPVCVIAALDIVDQRASDPTEIEARAVLDRFEDYVSPEFGSRGRLGYQPLWHLTKDGLWRCMRGDQVVTKKDFARGDPASRKQLLSKVDRLEICENLKKLWSAPGDRQKLRIDMLRILYIDSGAEGRKLTRALFYQPTDAASQTLPSDDQLQEFFDGLSDQLSLLDNSRSATAEQTSDISEPAPSLTLDDVPQAIEGIPSPVDFEWSAGKIVVGPGAGHLTVFPNAASERDHVKRLEVCDQLASDLAEELASQCWQVRPDYLAQVRRYISRLPHNVASGNVLLADAAARTLHAIFEAEQSFIPVAFAASLRTLLQAHYALRPFYPELDEFYRAVQTGRISDPLPMDAVEAVVVVVREYTPSVFDESVSTALADASQPTADVSAPEPETSHSDVISPPPDPLGELDPGKARDLQTAGALNRLWKVFAAGSVAGAAVKGWSEAFQALKGPFEAFLQWLKTHHGM